MKNDKEVVYSEPQYRDKERNKALVKNMQNRLAKVNGQIAGVKKMMEDNRDSIELLIQLYACQKALKSVMDMVFEHHFDTQIVDKLRTGDDKTVQQAVDETMEVLKNLRG